MGLEKDHDFPNHLLLGPGLSDAFLTFWTDTFELEQPVRVLFDDVEDCFTKSTDQFPGKVGTDPNGTYLSNNRLK